MTGGGHRRWADGARRGTRWLRLGCLLAVGEVIVLALVAVHPGDAVGTGATVGHQVTSVGQTSHQAQNSSVALPSPVPTAPAVTVPLSPQTPTTVPPTTVPTSPPPAAPAVSASGVLPADIAPQPNFLQSCSGTQYDDSTGCVGATLEAIANGRGHEGLPPMVLPSNWDQLSPPQQIFVATNLERTARGLAPMSAMATSLDQAAQRGAVEDTDPPPPSGFPYSQWGSNWAGAVGNPLEAVYFWMYDDGTGSANIDCNSSNRTGCWGHRENVLLKLPCTVCLMGTGWDPVGYSSDPSMTEVLVESSGSPALDFTWQQESAYLP